MKRASYILFVATMLLATAGCGIGDRLFYCHKPWGGDCNSCGCSGGGGCSSCGCNGGGCCNGSGMTDGGSYPGGGCPCGQGGCGNGACGAGGCGPGGCGDGYAMNGGDPNDPNGAHGYAHGPIPRGVGGEYLGAAGPPTGAVAYPYYTNRGPRDYLAANPPSIGP